MIITNGMIPVISITADCLPEKYRIKYNITTEETDLSSFYE